MGRKPQGPHLWRGQFFRTHDELARAAGVTRSQVSTHYTRHKNFDTLGVGSGGGARPGAGRPGHPLVVLDQEFRSKRHFSRTVGVSLTAIRQWIAQGRFDRLETALKEHNDAKS